MTQYLYENLLYEYQQHEFSNTDYYVQVNVGDQITNNSGGTVRVTYTTWGPNNTSNSDKQPILIAAGGVLTITNDMDTGTIDDGTNYLQFQTPKPTASSYVARANMILTHMSYNPQ